MSRTAISSTVARANKLRRKGSSGMKTATSSSGGGGWRPNSTMAAPAPDDEPFGLPRPKWNVLHLVYSFRSIALFKEHQVAAYKMAWLWGSGQRRNIERVD